MTPEEHEQIEKLCKQITEERDHDKFIQLVAQLNDLLDRDARLELMQKPKLTAHNPTTNAQR